MNDRKNRKSSTSRRRWLDFAQLEAEAHAWDALVAVTEGVDRFCSGSDWILPARIAFAPQARPFVAFTPDAAVALMRIDAEGGHEVAVPLEAGWGLACPFAGADPLAQVDLLDAMLDDARRPPDALFLSGIERGGPLFDGLVRRFSGRCRLGLGPPSGRRSTSIEGGVEGFLGRRSAKFRAGLRRAARKAGEDGFFFEYRDHFQSAPAIAARLMSIERRSWKGRSEQGVSSGPPRLFYEEMVRRFVDRGALRVVFARYGDEDVAFCFGGVLGEAYRGLQVSFVQGYEAWSPGNLAQLEMIRGLASEGVRTYHLGMEMPYKARWAEEGLETITLALLPP